MRVDTRLTREIEQCLYFFSNSQTHVSLSVPGLKRKAYRDSLNCPWFDGTCPTKEDAGRRVQDTGVKEEWGIMVLVKSLNAPVQGVHQSALIRTQHRHTPPSECSAFKCQPTKT